MLVEHFPGQLECQISTIGSDEKVPQTTQDLANQTQQLKRVYQEILQGVWHTLTVHVNAKLDNSFHKIQMRPTPFWVMWICSPGVRQEILWEGWHTLAVHVNVKLDNSLHKVQMKPTPIGVIQWICSPQLFHLDWIRAQVYKPKNSIYIWSMSMNWPYNEWIWNMVNEFCFL